MNNHRRKETRIKPRERAIKPRNKAPRQCKVQITRIVDLACISIPSINQNTIPGFCFDNTGIVDGLPRELREGFARDESAALLGAEPILLTVGGIPDPVHEEVGGEEGDQNPGWLGVGTGGVVGEVDCAVAVREGYAGQVPENEHKAPFLVVHVPVHFISSYPPGGWLGEGNTR